MISEYEKQIRDKLFELMRDNPDLPIRITTCRNIKPKSMNFDRSISIRYPIVTDVVAAFGILVIKSNRNIDGYMLKALQELYLDSHRFDKSTKEEINAAFDALPWKKMIIIPI